MTMSALDNLLWAAGFFGHVALLLVLLFKKRWKNFPVLTAMVAFQASRTVLLFFVSRYATPHAYFLAYWRTGAIDYALQVALIFEIARDVLRPTGTWIRDARRSFLLCGAAGLVVAALMAMRLGPPQSRGLDLWETRITAFTSMLTCELFIAMSFAANRLGLQRRSRVVAVGQGIAVWAFTALLEDLGHAAFGWNLEFVIFAHVRMAIYVAVLGYWINAFSRPEKVRAPLSPEMNAYLLALHRRVQYDLGSIDGPHL